jgi:hypothetical protein
MSIQEKFKLYLDINKEIAELRKAQANYKKQLAQLETDIDEYMEKNSMDSIALKEGEIVRYDRKVNQTFKRESMVECLNNTIKDEEKAEKLVESILTNKTFKVEKKLKVNIKKTN